MGHLSKAERFEPAAVAVADSGSAGMYLPSLTSEVRIQGAFGSYYLSWDSEAHDPELPPLQISDGPYLSFRGALHAARRRIRKDRIKLHEAMINSQWQGES